MQAEPAIMEKYRRFVVLKATHDNTLVYHYEVSLFILVLR